MDNFISSVGIKPAAGTHFIDNDCQILSPYVGLHFHRKNELELPYGVVKIYFKDCNDYIRILNLFSRNGMNINVLEDSGENIIVIQNMSVELVLEKASR